MKFIKKYILRWRYSQSSEQTLLRNYPKIINKVGIFTKSKFMPDTNFITKLKNGFGTQIQIFIFVLEDNFVESKDFFKLTLDDFSLFGQLKNMSISDTLEDLDALIDMTLNRTTIKDFVFNNYCTAYKISLGSGFCNNCNLIIDINPPDKKIFVDEIIKYHNILNNE